MGKKAITILFTISLLLLLVFILPLFTKKTLAETLKNGQAVIDNSSFGAKSGLIFYFTTASEIPKNGQIRITLPPDFDTSALTNSNLKIVSNGCSGWETDPLSPSVIVFKNTTASCPQNSNFVVTVGTNGGKMTNPQPSENHLIGQAETFPIKIETRDNLEQKIDEVIVRVAIVENLSAGINVGVFFSKTGFLLFGYTSPLAKVQIEGKNIREKITAKNDGSFQFNLVPAISSVEVCLVAEDLSGRGSSPVCLPAFPKNYSASVGPVLLAPTLSLDKKSYFVGDEVRLSGQSIPNTPIDINIFIDETVSAENYLTKLQVVRQVEAFSFPKLSTTTDQNGDFSISLPSSSSQFFRLFVKGAYLNQGTPKSNILNLKIQSALTLLIGFFSSFVKSRLLILLILAQFLGLFLYLMRRYFHPHVIAKNRALAKRQQEAIVLREKFSLLELETK